MQNILNRVREELKNNIDEKTGTNSQKFFKEKINFYGVRVPLVHKISKQYFKHIEQQSKSEIFELCESLWKSGFIEESFIACNWSYAIRKRFEKEDFKIFVNWIDNYINNWASCDTFCNHTLGTFIEMFPEYLSHLKIMAVSDNRWMRRASAVSLIVPARKGKFLEEIIEIADILLLDKDDMVQKGYGWLLKTASQTNLQAIYNYVMKNKSVMPRTSLRYAIEKMPPELKSQAMQK